MTSSEVRAPSKETLESYTCVFLSVDGDYADPVEFLAPHIIVACDKAFDLAKDKGERTGFELWHQGSKCILLLPKAHQSFPLSSRRKSGAMLARDLTIADG